MKLRKIKPSLIRWPEVRVTARFDEETRELLRKTIKEAGILSPIIAQEIEGEVWGVDGLHRCEDLIAAGDLPTDVAILDGDMVDLLCRNLFLDSVRGKPPVGDMVRVISVLFGDHNLDSDQIKDRTGLTRDYIEKLIKIGTSSPSVQEALDLGVIGVGHAYEISRLPYAIQQEEVIAKQQVYRYKVSDLREYVNQTIAETTKILTEAPGEQPPGAPRIVEYYCEGCKGKTEPRYLRPVMLCPNCFGDVWRLAKAKEQTEAAIVEVEEGA